MTTNHPQKTSSDAPGKVRFSRRELAEGTAVLGVLGILGAAGWSAHPDDARAARRVLPPGTNGMAELASRCLRCNRCISVCHARVIAPSGWDDGLLLLRTPKLDFRAGWCDLCGDCAAVCPTGAISPFLKETEKVGIAVVTESCIALRTGACRICHEKCPEKAVSLTPENAPVVDAEKCNGCGLCEHLCPANVFQSYRSGRERGIVVRPISNAEE